MSNPITRSDLYQLKFNLDLKLGWQNIYHDDNNTFEMKCELRSKIADLLEVMDTYQLEEIPSFA